MRALSAILLGLVLIICAFSLQHRDTAGKSDGIDGLVSIDGESAPASDKALDDPTHKPVFVTIDPYVAADRRGKEQGGYLYLAFDDLMGFDYELPVPGDGTSPAQRLGRIPEQVRKLDQRLISITGYGFPLAFDGQHVTEFFLLRRIFKCCFGEDFQISEVVDCRYSTGNKGPVFGQDTPVEVQGTLRVGEDMDGGGLNSIYQLQVDSVRILDRK